MNILVLNGSPRPQGNTKKLVNAFKEGAESAGHRVDVIDVCRKKIANIVIPKGMAHAFKKMTCRRSLPY